MGRKKDFYLDIFNFFPVYCLLSHRFISHRCMMQSSIALFVFSSGGSPIITHRTHRRGQSTIAWWSKWWTSGWGPGMRKAAAAVTKTAAWDHYHGCYSCCWWFPLLLLLLLLSYPATTAEKRPFQRPLEQQQTEHTPAPAVAAMCRWSQFYNSHIYIRNIAFKMSYFYNYTIVINFQIYIIKAIHFEQLLNI